ncbi:CDP-alcohol phosphatidyltransferase family protein [Candidatus Litorirhabdus singularis]|nr:CDP-alcohol phosphatidyltransferase family protein [Candidatus Litorirhabdus singularis]
MLTTLRLMLALPISWLILEGNYGLVLWVAAFAGFTDGVDGWIARKLDATSRYGGIVDPLADKLLLGCIFVSLAVVGQLPWWVAATVVLRDLVIVIGAVTYHFLYGAYEAEPSLLGKLSTLLQIVFAILVLISQLTPLVAQTFLEFAQWSVIILAAASGGHYVFTWAARARASAAVLKE